MTPYTVWCWIFNLLVIVVPIVCWRQVPNVSVGFSTLLDFLHMIRTTKSLSVNVKVIDDVSMNSCKQNLHCAFSLLMRVVSFLHFKVITKVPSGRAAPPCCRVDEMMHVLWVLRAHVILLGFLCAVSLLLPGFNLQRWIEHKGERQDYGHAREFAGKQKWILLEVFWWTGLSHKELCITVLLTQKLHQCLFLHCLPAEQWNGRGFTFAVFLPSEVSRLNTFHLRYQPVGRLVSPKILRLSGPFFCTV